MESECSSRCPQETYILVLSQENPVHDLKSHICNIHFNFTLSPIFSFSKLSHFSQVSPPKLCGYFAFSISSPFILPPEKYLLRIEFIKQFSPVSYYSPFLGATNLISTLFTNALSMHSILN